MGDGVRREGLVVRGGVAVECGGRVRAVRVPSGVVELAEEAFAGCSLMKSVVLPDSLLEIGDYAFEGCAALESIVIPESVTRLGFGVFDECDSLRVVGLPASFATIVDLGFAFAGCSALERLDCAFSFEACSEEDLTLAFDWGSPILEGIRRRCGRCISCGEAVAPGFELCELCS